MLTSRHQYDLTLTPFNVLPAAQRTIRDGQPFSQALVFDQSTTPVVTNSYQQGAYNFDAIFEK